MGVLTQKGRFAGHVRTGDKPDVTRFNQMAVIRDEALAGGEHGFDHGMAATGDLEAAIVTNLGAAELPPRRQRRRCHCHINGGKSPRRRRQYIGRLQDRRAQAIEDFQFAGEGPVGGCRQVTFQFSKFGGGEPHRLRRCLAMNELFVLHQLFSMCVANIDMIAEDIVVLDLERGNAGRLAITLLQGRNQPAAFIAKPAQLVQRRIKAAAYKSAVPCQQWRIIGKRRRQLCRQRGRSHHRGMQAVKFGRLVNADIARGGSDHIRGGAKCLRKRQQVTRSAMPHRQSRQCTIDIGKPLEHGPQIVTKVRSSQIPGHQIQTAVDQLRVRQRRADACSQKTAAGRRHRHVDSCQQASTSLAGQGSVEFKRASGGLVDFHIAGPGNSLERAHARHVALLRQVNITEQSAGSRQHGTAELAKTVEAGDPVIAAQRALPGRRIKQRRRLFGQQKAQRLDPLWKTGIERHDEFCRHQHGKQAFKALRRNLLNGKITCRHVGPGKRRRCARPAECGKIIVILRWQKIIFGQGAGGQDANDLAAQRSLAPTLFLRFRVLYLLADGNAVPGSNQPREISVNRMNRHAAHRNVIAITLASFCQGDAKRCRTGFGIFEEHLVEIAHPVEKQRIRMRLFHREVLRDHRCRRLYFRSARC